MGWKDRSFFKSRPWPNNTPLPRASLLPPGAGRVAKRSPPEEELGYIERSPARPRAIRVLDPDGVSRLPQCRYVPLLGRIRAGEPLFAEENLEGYFPLPAKFTAGGEYFMLRVEGESMSGAGIHDGDLVIVRRQKTVENGEVAAFLLGDEATVKRFYREKNMIRLQPANDQFEPILTREVEVLGRVAGLFRRL